MVDLNISIIINKTNVLKIGTCFIELDNYITLHQHEKIFSVQT